VGGDVGHPRPSKAGGPHVGIIVSHSSSLPLDTRGGVGPHSGEGGEVEGHAGNTFCRVPPVF